MTAKFPHRFLRLGIAIACILLIAVGLANGLPPLGPVPPPLDSGELVPLDSSPRSVRSPEQPQALTGLPVFGAPTPLPTAVEPSWPDWVETLHPTTLWSRPESPRDPLGEVMEGHRLRVFGGQGGRLLVYHGGGGEEDDYASEGWVDLADVAPAGAPKWVMARWELDVRRVLSPSAPLSARLPARSVLEVLEDRGKDLRVFFLGDGRTREAVEGWVKASEVGAAGKMLAAERRGMRLLTRSEVVSLQSGDGLWIKVPYRTQLDGSPSASANCGPASVGMVLESFHSFLPTQELRAAANKLQGTSGPDSGFAIEHLKSLAERYGLKGHDLYAGEAFKRWSLKDLRAHLIQGHLVIPQLRFRLMPGRAESDSWDDHYVVISGMRGDDFIYNDSVDADGPGYGRVMSAEALVRAWGGSNFPFAAFAVSKP